MKKNIWDSDLTIKLVLTILLIVGVSVGYQAIHIPEATSLDYSMPMAKNILSGKIWSLNFDDPYVFFPASSYVILAMFVMLHIPINLFALLSWVALIAMCVKLGITFGLKKSQSYILAASFCLTTSVVRTLLDQSIDKWLTFWFAWGLILLQKPKKTLRHSLALGLSMGMLFGSKYSGPLFGLALAVVYVKTLIKYFNIRRFLVAGLAFSLTGLVWYIRNWVLTGNPLYPAPFLFFKGFPNYTQQDWMLWKIPLLYPAGVWPLISAYISEYLIWSLAFIPIVWFLVRNKNKIPENLNKLLGLIVTTGLVSLMLPITTPYYIEIYHTISDMRYIHIWVILQMLVVFKLADKYKLTNLLTVVAVINMLPIFSFIPYYPKIVILGISIVMMPVIFRKQRI